MNLLWFNLFIVDYLNLIKIIAGVSINLNWPIYNFSHITGGISVSELNPPPGLNTMCVDNTPVFKVILCVTKSFSLVILGLNIVEKKMSDDVE